MAPTNATILIEGESGTGKEVIARALHEKSLRKDKPYIKVNCAAVPENLLESEFFGHEHGAFTGATMKREGRFELANGGTLLLDEITEISLPLQAKLLRVLQEHEFERVGGSRTIKVDVRIIATTNREPDRGGRRRANSARTFTTACTSCRSRCRAWPTARARWNFCSAKFLEQFAQQHTKPVPKVSAIALDQLARYPWPGNVRELRNYAERAVILANDDARTDLQRHLPLAHRACGRTRSSATARHSRRWARSRSG